ncbi:hypothetical protein HDF16_001165 [Granulicella aggregans]|uniref:Uncharacterized protein n=1 Tax=Granulicella aggregans TaxID=474949 RepID=A0A7W8E3U1_9BACT|nr:hypothetical protein [Granulicella aggregans]MBB5056480.1 hypothetical protein [Granulicella aggregans]
MTDILGGISNFFKKRRAHCAEHEAYQPDCAACVRANDNGDVASWGAAGAEFLGGNDSALDMTSTSDTTFTSDATVTLDVSFTSDTTFTSDAPSADVSDTSDIGGFDGGDSGGGGASGDF